MSSFEPGSLLSGKYRVEHVLGKGGMGVVLLATHVELHTRVAVKILPATADTSAEVVSRFLREAQAASKLKSEFVARVTDFGRLDGGQPFMVMELLEGDDFETVLTGGHLPPTEAVDAVVQACAALAEAHAAGIVHRDVKPSNLFRTTRPDGSQCVKVLDFGISKVAEPGGDKPLTGTGRFMGTPLYMSPEQLRSPKDVDARTDVWSLGVVLYQLLSGKPPFLAEEMSTLLVRILESEPESILEVRPELSPDLASVVHRCLEKDREKRVPSMRELARLLTPFASLEGGMAARRASITRERSGSPSSRPKSSPRADARKRELQAGLAETMDAGSVSVENAPPTQVAAGSAIAPPDGATRASGTSEAHPGVTRSSKAWWSLAAAGGIVVAIGVLLLTARARDDGDGMPETPPPPRAFAPDEPPVSFAAPGMIVVSPQLAEVASSASAAPLPSASSYVQPSSSARSMAAKASGAPRPASSSAPRPPATTLF